MREIAISVLCAIAPLLGPGHQTLAQETGSSESASMVSVEQSLESAPWYDHESNQLNPVFVAPRNDDSEHRNSRWRPKAQTIKKKSDPNANNPAASGTGLFGTDVTLGNIFGWALLIATILLIVGVIIYAVSHAELGLQGNGNGEGESEATGLPDEETLERIKHLPPELRRTDVNLRTECERLMNEGRFDQAIILLLGHQLLLLDQNGMLRLARGKTNGRYVRETRSHDAECGQWLRQTADAFEQSYFGRHEIPSDLFGSLWTQNSKLEAAIDELGGLS